MSGKIWIKVKVIQSNTIKLAAIDESEDKLFRERLQVHCNL